MNVLAKNERDTILNTLNNNQKDYLHNLLKRGKKTTFSNILAKYKGEGSNQQDDLSSIWNLVDYIDAGEVSPDLKCECGRSLRYQYIVKNKVTNTILKFGIYHFEEHTKIPANVVKDILKGWNYIDYELDEILGKVQSQWSLMDENIFEFPQNLIIPKDIKEMLDLMLPLLDKQIIRLKKLIQEETYKEKQITTTKTNKVEVVYEEEELDLFSFGQDSFEKINRLEEMSKRSIYAEPLWSTLYSMEQNVIIQHIQNKETISVMDICIELIDKKRTNFGYSPLSGKPKLYIPLSSFLDYLVTKGQLEFVMDNQRKDRIYKKI